MKRERLIQLLVDHELEPSQRKQLIESISRDDAEWQAEGWKEIALAFVEKQILDETLGHDSRIERIREVGRLEKSRIPESRMLHSNPSAQSEVRTDRDEASIQNKVSQSTHNVSIQQTPRRFRRDANDHRPSLAGWGIAIAVAFLFVGYAIGGFTNSLSDLNSQTGSNSNSISDGQHPDLIEGTDLSISLTDALARSSTPIPDQFRRDLLSAGYVLNEDQEIQTVSLPFGGTIEMPVRKIDIRYLGSSVYQ